MPTSRHLDAMLLAVVAQLFQRRIVVRIVTDNGLLDMWVLAPAIGPALHEPIAVEWQTPAHFVARELGHGAVLPADHPLQDLIEPQDVGEGAGGDQAAAKQDELLWDGFDDVEWDEVGAQTEEEELWSSFGGVDWTERGSRGEGGRNWLMAPERDKVLALRTRGSFAQHRIRTIPVQLRWRTTVLLSHKQGLQCRNLDSRAET